MKNRSRTIVSILLASILACFTAVPLSGAVDLKDAFLNPSIDAHPGVYWYWMNGNVTKEGVIADLKGMNDVGVRWVYLMDIGVHPAGKVSNRSKEWYDLVGTALSEAKKYGIKVHMSSPGWAVSGGPWITPEKSMKELVWSEARVEGGKQVDIRLKQPSTALGFYRDIAVFAFPTPKGDNWASMSELNPIVKSVDGKVIADVSAMFDGEFSTVATLPNQFDIILDKPVDVRSVFLRAARANGYFEASIDGWDAASSQFVKLGTLKANNAGPFSAQVAESSFAAMKSDKFRITMTSRQAVVEELALYGGVRMPNWVNKSGCGAADQTISAETPIAYPPISEADVVKSSEIINLTNKLSSTGELKWNAPSGNWTILRMGYTSTGIKLYPPPVGGDGLECDKMSKEISEFQYQNAIKAITNEVGPEMAKALTFQHIDSYEASWQTWTEGFDKEFADRCGYDIIQCLPAMTGRVVESTLVTDKFYWDMRNVISDMFIESHYKHSAEAGRKDGLKFSNEPYGGPFNFLKLGAVADLPMVEFWTPSTQPREGKINFQGVFTGRTNGKKVIASETYTSESPSERWNHHPFNLKATGDYIYCSGVNRFIMHVSAMQPFVNDHLRPGLTCGVNGIHFDRGNTWWEHGAKDWCDYLARCQSLLQSGEHVADVLYFQGNEAPSESRWFTPELPLGYDFDACSEDVFLNLKVVDGRIVLPTGKSYKYVVLPDHGWMTTASLIKSAELAASGATIVGKPVGETPSLKDLITDNGERDAAIKQLWGDVATEAAKRKVGNGRVIWGMTFASILAEDNLIPDFTYDQKAGLLINYIHRVTDSEDFYFVANGKAQEGWVKCRFRVADNMIPQLWNPDNGTIENCEFYTRGNGYIEIPVHLDPAGSVFVVFKKSDKKERNIVSVTYNGEPIGEKVVAASRLEASPNISRKVWDDFTVSFWCKPNAMISLPKQTNQGVYWDGQNWAVFPSPGHNLYGLGNSGAGVSVGRNGVAVFEHWEGNVAPLLVYKHPAVKSDWYHVTIAYEKGKPSLYVNGEFVAEGLKSGKRAHPSTYDVNDQNKSYLGAIVDIKESPKTMSPETIADQYAKLSKPTTGNDSDESPILFIDKGDRVICELYRPGIYKFKKASGAVQTVNLKKTTQPVAINTPWTLDFPEGWGAPQKVVMDKLIPLNEHSDFGVKHFSGTATYNNTFSLTADMIKSGKSIYLDLGEVNVIAEVTVNGKPLDLLWKPPFRLNIDSAVKEGTNTIEVKVTNLWANRMIGDEQFPTDISYNDGNGLIREWPQWLINNQPRPEQRRLTFSAIRAWNKDDNLLPSGLVGPVIIRFVDQVEVTK